MNGENYLHYFRNVNGFFSDYFFAEIDADDVVKSRLNAISVNKSYRKLLLLFQKTLGSPSRLMTMQELWTEWLYPLLQELGYLESIGPLNLSFKEGEWKNIPMDDSLVLIIIFSRKKLQLTHQMKTRLAESRARLVILTNGQKIRLYRWNGSLRWSSYLEIALEDIFRDYNRDAFRLFWLIFHISSFKHRPHLKTTFLEELMQASWEKSRKIGQLLKFSAMESVELFFQAVIKTIVNFPADIRHQYLEQLESVVNEIISFTFFLLFMTSVEERGFLPGKKPELMKAYTFTHLRKLILEWNQNLVDFSSQANYIQQSLFLIADLNIKVHGLDVLFPFFRRNRGTRRDGHPWPLLRKLCISDVDMIPVLEKLWVLRDDSNKKRALISFRELGVDEIGRIYEDLLDVHPQRAKEDLALIHYKGSQSLVSLRKLPPKAQVIKKIPKGQYYLKFLGFNRKQSGTYYTPKQLTHFLVEKTLASLTSGKTVQQILSLKILDPAMGSGAFLLAAADYLADCLEKALITEKNGSKMVEEEQRESCSSLLRKIFKHCIYGVDKNPLAVQLAMWSAWLATLEASSTNGLEFDFQDHFKCGDSLIGADFSRNPHEREQFVSSLQQYLQDVELTGKSANHVKIPFHWSLEFPEIAKNGGFDAIITNPPWEVYKPRLEDFYSVMDPTFRDLGKQDKIKKIKELNREDPSLQPKWEQYQRTIQAQVEFFKHSGLFSLQGRGNLNSYKLFLERALQLLKPGGRLGMILPSGIYTDLGSVDLRKYLFASTKIDFLIAMENRAKIFPGVATNFKFCLLCLEKMISVSSRGKNEHQFPVSFLLGDAASRGNWARSKIARGKKKHGNEKSLMLNLEKVTSENLGSMLTRSLEKSVLLSANLIKKLSGENLTILEIQERIDLEIFMKCHDLWPTLGQLNQARAGDGPWFQPRLHRGFDMTNDSRWFIATKDLPVNLAVHDDFWLEDDEGRWYHPLFEGKMIWQHYIYYRKPRYWIRWNPFEEQPNDLLRKLKILPDGTRNHQQYRVVYRDVSSSANERTLVAAILPPNVFHNNKLPCFLRGDESTWYMSDASVLYLSALLNSLLFDYLIRKRAGLSLNFFQMYMLPFPPLKEKEPLHQELLARVARLTCISQVHAQLWERTFNECWKEVSVTSALQDWKELASRWTPQCGVTDWTKFGKDVRDGKYRLFLRTEIDALVAILFDLSSEELLHILHSFPVLRAKEERYFGSYLTEKLVLKNFEKYRSTF